MPVSRGKRTDDLEGQEDVPFLDEESKDARNDSFAFGDEEALNRTRFDESQHNLTHDYPPASPNTSPQSHSWVHEFKHGKWRRMVVPSIMLYLLYASYTLFRTSGPSDWWWAKSSPVVFDLLDPTVYVKTPGQSLLDRGKVNWGPFTLNHPTDEVAWTAQAGEPFTLTVQCDATIVGTEECSPQYVVHFRGPVSEAVPSNPALYKHDLKTGTTEIRHTLIQAGFYDIWITPEVIGNPDCSENDQHWTVKGSGQRPLHVVEAPKSSRLVSDGFRECTTVDYEGPAHGRWISVPHINPKYRLTPWLQSHLQDQDTNLTTTDQYIYVPYRCKQTRLDVKHSLEELPSVKHVAYIGDSILRTSFCGHLYPSLHDGQIGGNCLYSDDLKTYHYSSKTFEYSFSNITKDTHRGVVRFSQRFLTDEFDKWQDTLADLVGPGVPPLTHVIVNVGLWLALIGEEAYIQRVSELLDYVQAVTSPSVHIIWASTPSVSPGIVCYNMFKRRGLRHHGILAQRALGIFRERFPLLKVDFIDYYRLTDARPETSTDGRHWVREDQPIPWMYEVRPWVGAADNALFQWAWDIWRVRAEDDQSARVNS
ncbi:hypothetical protein MVLG_01243 [Microbotryum lychnidis-dioicae p1A1 Lamole]|uniref:Uncharacterized protein n=1 Tax=Microbotryum lychnidis-dioicae (strain p1A1 Lamole / MvSl-1064) TaxID=683840 RepID=U5H1I7_USTV1|nr:hypothetical protein MVLG_01243 [Microbotryum lychnidis-dioicae p1A1 Lamole]|eukprot:KDE08461.1 hypothetical protein MVLG_01243 [Microbotryum lychnidis-dioicae p1A1 Lamole]